MAVTELGGDAESALERDGAPIFSRRALTYLSTLSRWMPRRSAICLLVRPFVMKRSISVWLLVVNASEGAVSGTLEFAGRRLDVNLGRLEHLIRKFE